ncbi:RICIN domain-containing protein [Kitasatospora sp. NPDC059973]|uniref:RICIN domain-containing protein n=1 Tax=Kitasatospora sp. NPDC059973 TaxID=3347020 RepID=UPI0036BD7CAC
MKLSFRHVGRLLSVPFTVTALLGPALALAATPAAATSTTAATAAAATDAYTFTNGDGTLNATGNNDGNQISVTPDGTNYQNFRLIKLGTPGQFNIASTSSGKCVYATQPATQKSCGQDGEQWHFRPVDGKPNSFGIVRRDDASGTEWCMDNRGGLHLWGILAQPNVCNGSAAQEWRVPAAKAAEARSLALDYYADLCARKTATCSWTEKSEGQPEVLPRQPASSVWYNDTADKVTQVFTTIYHSGWSQSFGVGLSSSVGVSVPVQAMVSTQLQTTTTYESDQSTINGIAVTVPAKNYGWVDFAAVGKKVTGTWTFDTDNQPWTTDATVTVPVINSTAGSTMYVAHTSPDQPGTTSVTSADAPALTMAAKASFTPDLPDGTAASQDGPNTVKLVDTATGARIGTIKPSAVVDTKGTTHPVSLTVSGNVITQTIENASGDTIDGSMTMPSVSYNTTTAPAAKTGGLATGGATTTGVTTAAFTTTAFTTTSAKSTVRPAFWPIPDREHPKNSDEWNKCMAKELGKSMVEGAAKAALLGALRGGQLGAAAGPEGAAAGAALGMLTGTVTGLGKAYYVCGTDPG